MQNDRVLDDHGEEHHPHLVQVLFSAAGTGKTRHLFQLLQNHWGFYMVAPNLQPGGEDAKTADIIEPQRYSVSRDTLTMFEDHPQMDPRWPRPELEVFFPIITARCALLHEFLNKYPEETPSKWLFLQVYCQKSDPFDVLYRLFRLSNPLYLTRDSNIYIHTEIPAYVVPSCYAVLRDLPSTYFNGTLYHCFDEAQVALDDADASSMFDNLYAGLTLHDILTTDWFPKYPSRLFRKDEVYQKDKNCLSWMDDGMPLIQPTLVISGTSLRLEELKEKLTGLVTDAWDTDPWRGWQEAGFHDMFPLVASDQDFWKLYEEHTTSVLNEHDSARVMMQDMHTSDIPLMSRSGRPLTLAMNQDADFGNMRSFLQQPLKIPPLQDVLKLLAQAYKFISTSGQTIPGSDENVSSLNLEELLERQNCEEVAVLLAISLVGPLVNNGSTDNDVFEKSVLSLLEGYGDLQPDQILKVTQHELAQPLPMNFSFAELSGILHDVIRNVYIRNLITSRSLGQRGRYRWSILYIEEIIQSSTTWSSKDCSLTDISLSVEKAKINSSTAAVEALKSQVRKMKAAGKIDLVQDLFRAAIRAEMMSTPSIFLKKSHADLVTYGFALVQRDGETMRYTLSEPIAIHAIMDYLRKERGDEYEELMLQWLIHTQDDYEVGSMFGKATEWFVAMSFDRMLRRQSFDGTVLPDLLDGAKRRGTLLQRFGEAKRLNIQSGQASTLRAVVQITDYALPETSTVFEYRNPSTIWKWMGDFRTKGSGSTPTFMFPDINAGPDLIFVLEERFLAVASDTGITPSVGFQDTKRLFVAVQIKTGQSARFEDAMETLVESNWHKNIETAARDKEMQELEHWKDTPVLLLLICTGITIKQKKIDKWIENNAAQISGGRFICVLDETVTSDIWGQDFVALADSIKRQNTQRQRSWVQDVRKRAQTYNDGVIGEDQLAYRFKKRRHLDE
ncbi:hypothetical protein EDB82DRAFT_564211 [Fusarium venenatum]|uniref:uncharacterized protein n=1 Tax=Fusarium venenatum TaxID=56646 RepID=UPI001E0FDB42|nr:hypothetical protein EDB82DRAFT_564211 [Fusarium venenatum]